MKKLLNLIAVVVLLMGFSQCKKDGDGKMYNGYFYAMSANPQEGDLYLYIDGVYKGQLTYLKSAPTCDNDAAKKQALFIPIKSGSYLLEAKTKSGNLLSRGTLFFSENESSIKGSLGGQYTVMSGTCITVGLGE